MTDEKKVDDPELKVNEQSDGSVLVDDAAELKQAEQEKEQPEEPIQEDEKLSADEEGADEEGHESETAEEAEERRSRNRARRQQNKDSRKNYIESLKRELAARDSIINDLSTRVTSVEKHSVGNQMAQIDAAMKEAENYYAHYKDVNKRAIELADGNTAVDAQEKMFAAQQRFQMLQNAKKGMTQQNNQPKPLDPRLKQQAEGWMERNSWYDPSGSDQDSDIVLKIDDRLVSEGWNPTTPEYWEELDARVKKYLPHRAVTGYNKEKVVSKPRVPVGGSNRDSGGGQAKGSYRLSAERVQALKDAGVWDNPTKRADAIKRFQNFDRENGQAN